MIILSVILMDLLTGMEFDIFVPGFPELQNVFHLTPFSLALSLSVNFLAYCVSLFIVGELGDRYGRKKIVLIGLFIFLIGGLICLYAPSWPVFLGGRLLQGAGIAAPSILSFLIVTDLYPLKQQQFWMAMLNASMNVAAASAPVIGSYITNYFHWHGNFIALLVLGLTTFIMTLVFIPENRVNEHVNHSLLQGYVGIFKTRSIVLLMIYFMLMFVPYWIFVGISPLLYMQDLGVKLSQFGYYQGSLALTFAIGSLIFGYVVHRYDHKKMLLAANWIFIFSFISIMLVTVLNCRNPLLITMAFLPFVIGQIIPSNILYPLYLNLMPEAKSRLTALIQGGRLIFASVGLQIAGFYYDHSFYTTGIITAGFVFAAIIVMFIVVRQWQHISKADLI